MEADSVKVLYKCKNCAKEFNYTFVKTQKMEIKDTPTQETLQFPQHDCRTYTKDDTPLPLLRHLDDSSLKIILEYARAEFVIQCAQERHPTKDRKLAAVEVAEEVIELLEARKKGDAP